MQKRRLWSAENLDWRVGGSTGKQPQASFQGPALAEPAAWVEQLNTIRLSVSFYTTEVPLWGKARVQQGILGSG